MEHAICAVFSSQLSQPMHSQLAACPHLSSCWQGEVLVLSGWGADGGADGGRSSVGRMVALVVVIDCGSESRSQEHCRSLSRGADLIVRLLHAGRASHQEASFGNDKTNPHCVHGGLLQGAPSFRQGRPRGSRQWEKQRWAVANTGILECLPSSDDLVPPR